MHPLLLILFIGMVLLRAGSVVVSKRNEKVLKAQGAREYGRSTSHLLAAAHTLFYGGALLEGLWRRTQPTPWTTVGLVLYALAILALVLVWRELQGLWTVKLLMASDHRLNQSALFRWVRHPNYFLNIIPELVGLALIMGAWLVLVVGLPLYLLVLRRRIAQEEQVMREYFPHYVTLRVPPRAQKTPSGAAILLTAGRWLWHTLRRNGLLHPCANRVIISTPHMPREDDLSPHTSTRQVTMRASGSM